MDEGGPPAGCPSCGTSDEVRTIQQLFDLLNSVQDDATQQAEQLRQAPRPSPPPQRDTDDLQNPAQQEPAQQIANLVLDTAGHFIGKAIGKRVNRTYEERISPALEEQQSRAGEQSRQEQAAIIERHPDLRGGMRDQVLFVVGGTRVAPFTDVMPITLAHADALVNTRRAP
jgi:hypothetical protein